MSDNGPLLHNSLGAPALPRDSSATRVHGNRANQGPVKPNPLKASAKKMSGSGGPVEHEERYGNNTLAVLR